jgi:diguanylate cyclase (GGDEF)-like protein
MVRSISTTDVYGKPSLIPSRRQSCPCIHHAQIRPRNRQRSLHGELAAEHERHGHSPMLVGHTSDCLHNAESACKNDLLPMRLIYSMPRRTSLSSDQSTKMPVAEGQLSEVLRNFARTMLTNFPIQAILDQLVGQIVEVMPITGAGVTLLSESSNPHYVAASDEKASQFERLQTALDEGPCKLAYRTGSAVLIPDLRDEVRFPVFVPQALEAGLAAVFTFPLRQGDRRLGALDLYRDTPGPLSANAMVVAQTLADVTSAYLVNAQARADLLDSSTRAESISLHDPLTGLPNRILLLERIEHALLSRRRSGKHVAVLFIDLDDFKKVNDISGHHVGDDLLIAIGVRIQHLMRPGDTLARLSGDEFIIVCHELDDESQVEGIAKRLDDAIALPFELRGLAEVLTASIGIAFADDGDGPEDLLHRADVAMCQVKRKGGGHHQIINRAEQDITASSDSLRRDLRHAVERNELRLEYQPVIRTTDGRVSGLEALLRWDHPERGLISPAVLIPLAERSGDILEIGKWVLEQACADRHRWENKTGDGLFLMAVNVSAHQLMAAGFVATVEGVLSRTNTKAEHLALEVTESAFVQDAQRAFTVLTQLKELGVIVALDDFGTGYSSLSYLRQFPVDVIKVDQSFVAELTEDTSSHAIVLKTIELAHLLNLMVISEGVETAEQFRHVAALKSDLCQGFYFARPMTAEMLDEITSGLTSPWTISV